MKQPGFSWEQIDRLRQEHNLGYGKPPDNSFTCHQYADKYELTYQQADHHLRGMVRRGELVRVKYNVNGRHTNCFCLVPKRSGKIPKKSDASH